MTASIGVKPMNCPGHCYLSTLAQSTRIAICRFASPILAACIAIERSGVTFGSDPGAFLRPGRCAYFLHAGANWRASSSNLVAMTEEVYRTFQFDRHRRSSSADPAGEFFRAVSSCGTTRKRRWAGADYERIGLFRCNLAGRRRFLWAEDRFRRSAMCSKRSLDSWRRCSSISPCPSASISNITPSAGTEARPVMIASRGVGIHRALYRHSIRALRRRFSALAGAGAIEDLDRYR